MSSEKTEVKEEIKVEKPTHKGAILKNIREEKGIRLETIHEATKVPLDALRAIEEGYQIRILSDFYYRSFVKIYAKYLNVDPAQILEEKKQEAKPAPVAVSEPELEFNLSDKIDKVLTKERKQQIFYILAALFGLWLLFLLISFLISRKPAQKTVETQRQEEVVQKVEPVAAPIHAAPAQVIPSSEKTTQNPAITKDVILTVRANKGSWLRVKTDGSIVFQSTLKAGEVETWIADEKIEITGRNISQLEFELNGKLIGSLGRASRRAKGLVVTKEGLSVTK